MNQTPPKNIERITKWIEDNRPDILPQWREILEGDAACLNRRFQGFISLTLMGFDAGRVWQQENPCNDAPEESISWDCRHLPTQISP